MKEGPPRLCPLPAICALLTLAMFSNLGCATGGETDATSAEDRVWVDAYGIVHGRPQIRKAERAPLPPPTTRGENPNASKNLPDSLDGDGGAGGQATAADETRPWTILLATDTQEGHQTRLRQQLGMVGSQFPFLQQARVHTTERGSMIIYGAYTGPDDPNAQSDLTQVKQFTLRNRQPFATAHLTRITIPERTGDHPHSLAALRKQFPTVDPLYTLDVAVWIAEEADAAQWALMKQQAEAYAAQLRQTGFEAYFYHNQEARTSSVTVGKFDQNAIDPQSGFFSREVRELMDEFPVHLVNGERMLVRQGTGPNAEMVPQSCQLVNVPMFQ